MTQKSHYTTSEAASLLGYSRQHIGKAIRELGIDAQKSNKGYSLTAEQVNRLAEHFGAEPIAMESEGQLQADASLGTAADVSSANNAVDNAVAALTKQLEVKDAQIAAYQEQVATLSSQVATLLDANKALSAANAVQVVADKKERLLAEPEEEAQGRKRGFWARLFG